jgi:hypothetical protein
MACSEAHRGCAGQGGPVSCALQALCASPRGLGWIWLAWGHTECFEHGLFDFYRNHYDSGLSKGRSEKLTWRQKPRQDLGYRSGKAGQRIEKWEHFSQDL